MCLWHTCVFASGAIQLTRTTWSNLLRRPTDQPTFSWQGAESCRSVYHLGFNLSSNILRIKLISYDWILNTIFSPSECEIRWACPCECVIPNEAKSQSWPDGALWKHYNRAEQSSQPSRNGSPFSTLSIFITSAVREGGRSSSEILGYAVLKEIYALSSALPRRLIKFNTNWLRHISLEQFQTPVPLPLI